MKSKKPKCVKCPCCKAPAIKTPHGNDHGIEIVDLLTPLKDLVKVIRNFECGDYSPIMDELFDAESAIRLAEAKPKKGLDYE
jgi:hypothetical protein